jgi:hypothetical protein
VTLSVLLLPHDIAHYQPTDVTVERLRGGIQNIPHWCRHLYSSCGSAKHRSQKAKLWIPGSNAKFLWWLLENLRRRRPELWREHTWLLNHDSAASHNSVLAQQFLAKYRWLSSPHPPYTPDLAPCDFFLFPKLKLRQWNEIQ